MAQTNKRAREIERQRLARQEARRIRRAARRRKVSLFTGIGVVLALVGSYGGYLISDSLSSSRAAAPATSTTPTPTPSTSQDPQLVGTPVCHYLAAPGPGKKQPLPADKKATGTHAASIRLTQGTIQLAFLTKGAPCTVNSFVHLAALHYFDNTICHRLTTKGIFVLQCGDPTGSGSGGPGYTIPDENLPGAAYPAGTVAMANTGQPHTGGSQFFLVYKNTSLPPQYTPFATITGGMNVLLNIAKAGNDSPSTGDGHPKHPVKILSFTTT